MSAPIIVIGAGQAAAQFTAALRKLGDDTPVIVLGDEPHAPYQRPPLSKAFLKGAFDQDRLAFRSTAAYADMDVALRTGATVQAIDPAARTVHLSGGEVLAYSRLVIATGSTPRTLPSLPAAAANLFVLRTLDEALALQSGWADARRVVIIGGGYIGLEVAASARELGKQVTVIERAPRLLARVAGQAVSEAILALHQSHSVDVRLDTTITDLVMSGDRISAVITQTAETLAADVVVVGVGGAPNDALARAAGLACDAGIAVDLDGRTSAPDVFAAGDCACRPLTPGAAPVRLESVHNAKDMADRVAAAIAGAPTPAPQVPWFWSDQYDVKLQTASLSIGHDAWVTRCGPNGAPLSVFYLQAGRLIAADCLNDPAAFMGAKQLIAAGAMPDPAALADPATTLRDIVSAARPAPAT